MIKEVTQGATQVVALVAKLGELSSKLSTASGNNSIQRMAKATVLEFPLYYDKSIPRDRVTAYAKSCEVRIAYDVVSIVSTHLKSNPRDANPASIIGALPFKRSFMPLASGIANDANDVSNSSAIDLIRASASAEREEIHYNDLIAEARSFGMETKDSLLVPTSVDVKIPYVTSGDRGKIESIECTISILARPIPVEGYDLKRLFVKYDRKSFMKRYQTYLKGSDMTFMELITDIKSIKESARLQAKDKNALNELEILEKELGGSRAGKNPFICYLVDSSFAEDMSRTDRLDLYSPKDAKRAMKGLLAMNITIYEADRDRFKIMFSGDNDYVGYAGHEIMGDASKYRSEIQSLIKMNRR